MSDSRISVAKECERHFEALELILVFTAAHTQITGTEQVPSSRWPGLTQARVAAGTTEGGGEGGGVQTRSLTFMDDAAAENSSVCVRARVCLRVWYRPCCFLRRVLPGCFSCDMWEKKGK